MAHKKEKFIIIDGNALVHRAWHSLPPTMQTKNGELVNAVYGFTLTLLKVLKDMKPTHLAVSFDLAGPTFRHKEFKDYKATRIKQDQELYDQFPRIKEIVRAFNIPIYEKQGFEADDVIATIVRHQDVKGMSATIVTGDMDALQLVDKTTTVFTMRKSFSDTVIYDINGVKKRYDGLTPEQIIDYKALRGDPSDNIPGVKGIGDKGAIELLKNFGTIENIYKNLDSPKIKERVKGLLKEHKKDAIMSKSLATMDDHVKLDFKLADTRLDGYDLGVVMPLFQELEFKSLIDKLPKEGQSGIAPGQSAFDLGGEVKPKKASHDYTLVNDEKTFKAFLTELKKQKVLAIDTETTGLDPFSDDLLGISISWQDRRAFYITAKPEFLKQLKPILENSKIQKIGHNIKFDMEVLQSADINMAGIVFDTMVASYLINPGNRQHNLDGLVFTELGYQMQPITDLIGTGKSQISLKEVALEKVSDYACEDADFTWRLYAPLKKELEEKNNLGLLDKIEMPLIPVLARMEAAGVMLDTDFLKNMSKTVDKDILDLEKKIHKLAGTDFNIASPIQVKEVLFDKLEIATEGLSRTKTGISTAAGELEKIKNHHQIIPLILDYRELTKLKSTYLDALPKMVNAKDKRLHTNYQQTIAATGRLSSTDPNLQNIPIRTELGRKIRQAFVAPKDFSIVSADYSQIELRIIASLANDKKMIDAFKRGEDIHLVTAAEINGVKPDKVTKEMRYAAKAVNFGIIYGQGAWGLSEGAGISRAEAQEFIEKYFKAYSAVKKYLENVKAGVRKNGFAETWYGRRRYLPDINAGSQVIRAAAERAAINHPIQGTAADLMKLAMIEIDKKLPAISKDAKMMLQVHDELVFEVPDADIKKVAAMVEKTMEEVYKLRAPVEAHVSVGKNWGQLKPLP